ncbi:MAG: hypothetical protein GX633_05465 [Clostridiales bacterium]|nr:hypothetical protein [Clostridiales bacterium]
MNYPSQLTSKEIKTYLSEFSMPKTSLCDRDGTAYTQEYLDSIIAAVNLDAVEETNKVSYALALDNADIKKFPTISRGFASLEELDNDRFQQGRISIAEPVVILHTSLGQDWYFVQTRSNRGWVSADKLIFMEKGSWVNYINSENFIVVTGESIVLDRDPFSTNLSATILSMGTKLPLYADTIAGNTVSGQGIAASYVVKIPTRDKFGHLEFVPLAIPKSCDVSLGYLPYTSANIITQAFKLLGRRYGYQGLYDARDNAKFISDILSAFGIFMPSTIRQQSAIPANDIDLKSLTSDERAKEITTLAPGSLLYTYDCAFIYLGQSDGKPFIIYPATTFYYETNMFTANTVLITGMSVVQRDGIAFADAVVKAKLLGLVKEEITEEKGK